MTQANAPKLFAAIAAVATTLVLFGSVVSLADEDKAALALAKTKPTTLAQHVERGQR